MTQARASAFGELDIWLARAGRHERLWSKLGAHPVDGGVRFAVWAPNARQVSVIGDFNDWTSGVDVLQPVDETGIWEGDRRRRRGRPSLQVRPRRPREGGPGRVRGGGAAEDGLDRPPVVVHLARRGLDRRSAARASSSSGRSRSTRCTRRRGASGSAGASSPSELATYVAGPRLHARRADARHAPSRSRGRGATR